MNEYECEKRARQRYIEELAKTIRNDAFTETKTPSSGVGGWVSENIIKNQGTSVKAKRSHELGLTSQRVYEVKEVLLGGFLIKDDNGEGYWPKEFFI